MSTQNFSLTAGAAKNEDFSKNDAAVNDVIIAAVYVNGAIKLTKKSASNGGSTDEIGIVAATKYTLKLSAADTLQLPGSGVTYKLLKVVGNTVTELFNGTITVSGAVESSGVIAGGAQSYCYRQTVNENCQLDVSLPANGYIEKVFTINPNGYVIALDLGSGSAQDDIVAGAVTSGAEIVECTVEKAFHSADAATELWVSAADWDGGELDVIVVWKVMS